MNIKTLIYVILAYLIVNAVTPLLLHSVERLFQHKIDIFVKRVFSRFMFVFSKFLQFALIIFYAPHISLFWVIRKVYPPIVKNKYILRVKFYAINDALLKRDFHIKDFLIEIFTINSNE